MREGLGTAQRIPIAGPWITEKEIAYVSDAVANGWYENANAYQTRFEQAFAAYVGRKYAIALPSCTSALHLALVSLGVKSGDEVAVPEATWIGSSAPISYVGATPTFVDIDPQSWCMDVGSFERSITSRTKAVIVVNLYGNLPDIDNILEIARLRGVAVIEDAAESIGSEYKGRKAGSFGVISAFSFHGSKTLTTGEGGMLVTDDAEVYKRCLTLREHGRSPGSKMFWNEEVAFKYRMSSMQAALGLAQLERIEELIERKRTIFSWYRDALGEFDGIALNQETAAVRNTYWMVTVIVDESFRMSKEDLMGALAGYGVASRPFCSPLRALPAYSHLPGASLCQTVNRIAYNISARGVNLPSGLNLTKEQVQYVCDCLRTVLSRRPSS
jgi:perosamine synthetase